MSGEEKPKISRDLNRLGGLDGFRPWGKVGAITNKEEFEAKLKELPPVEQELAVESARFADLWQYFGDHRIPLPEDVVAEVAELSKLSAKEKIETLRHLNKKLMEHLHDVGEDSGIRQ